jgi:thiosulfate/3-mercaptopyruvate sulfurtransferase
MKMTSGLLRVFALLIAVLLGAPHIASAAPTAMPALVTPAWVRAHLGEKSLIVIEVYLLDQQRETYEKGHVPGAIFTGFFSDGWIRTSGDIPGLPPPQDKIDAILGGLGVTPDSKVVLVPGGVGLSHPNTFDASTWLYWVLNAEGVHQVSILNGGDDAWRAQEANAVATGSVKPVAVHFSGHMLPGYEAKLTDVEAAMKMHDPVLVDSRPPAQYEGKIKTGVAARAGTIPGSVNLPAQSLMLENGQGMIPEDEVKARIAKAGIKPGAAVIVFCNTSYLASADWFALRAVAGHEHALLYSGSMAEWTRHPELPVVNGQ